MNLETQGVKESWPSLGILGGMGIFASLKFVSEFYAIFQDLPDHERPRLILDMNTLIPSRGRHILYGEESPIPQILDSFNGLTKMGAELLTVTCNSAASLLDSDKSSAIPDFVNIISVTSGAIPPPSIDSQFCLVVGGRVTFQCKPYKGFLEASGFKQVEITEMNQLAIEAHIEEVKKFGFSKRTQLDLYRLIAELINEHPVDLVLLACTELDLGDDVLFKIPVINSRIELVKHISSNYYPRVKNV